MCIRQLGPLVGGAISLALNVKTSEKGKVTYTTYLGLVAISSLGAPLALLLSQPQDVVRSDGTQIPYMRKTNFGIEARAIWKQLRNKYMLLLIPVFLAGQFGVTYQGNYLTSMCLASAANQLQTILTYLISILHPPLPSPSFVPNSDRRSSSQHRHRPCPRPRIIPATSKI
jgi:hypothetical protein